MCSYFLLTLMLEFIFSFWAYGHSEENRAETRTLMTEEMLVWPVSLSPFKSFSSALQAVKMLYFCHQE